MAALEELLQRTNNSIVHIRVLLGTWVFSFSNIFQALRLQ